MSKWVEVPDVVMAEALKLAANGLERNQSNGYPVILLDALIEFFREAGGCDHSVNICCCGEEQAAYELELAKDGKRICPVCGSDGYTWDADKYEAARVEAAKEGYDASEGQGMVPCFKCAGKGVIDIDGEG